MEISQRQTQIKSWLKTRKTHFQPFTSLQFLNQPFNRSLSKEMEFETEKILNIETCNPPPPIRCFGFDDLQLVSIKRKNLPHWELTRSTYFVTFCLLERKNKSLKHPQVAKILEETIMFNIGHQYEIDAYVIMPDHVHLLITPNLDCKLSKILKSIKSFSTKKINQVLNLKGRLWQPENYDHLVRNLGYWVKYFDYIHNNPVKAEFVVEPSEYAWSSLSKWYKA